MPITDRIALLLTAPFVVLAGLRILPLEESFPLVAIEAEMAWVLLPAWALLGWAALRRSPAALGLAALPVAVHVVLLLTAFGVGAQAPRRSDTARVRFVAANVFAWNERADELARELAALDADVMMITELTPEWSATLEREGVLERFEHRVIVPRDDCFGIALLSRFALDQWDIVDLGGVPMVSASITVGGRPVRVLAVHTLPPREAEYTRVWRAQMLALGEMIDRDEATIVAGDLNASPFARSYRALLGHGVRGAHEAVGRGLATTWPNGMMPFPSMRLDHVLVSPSIDVLGVREGRGAGSDHRPVIADLAIGGR